MIALLAQLFGVFFVIGLFTFGGGAAMLSLIQTEVVTNHAWITEEAFTDIIAISQATPGPIGINCATYVGYEVLHNAGFSQALSVIGSATTTFALVLPSFVIFFAIVRFFTKFHSHPVFVGVMKTLKPAVAGLIFAAAVILIFRFDLPRVEILTENFPHWSSWLLAVAAFVLTYWFKANPIYIIVGAGVLGLIIY